MTHAERTAHLLAIRNRMEKIISLSKSIRQEMKELEQMYGIKALEVSTQSKYVHISNGIDLVAEAFGIAEPEITCTYFETKRGFLHREYEIVQHAKATKKDFLPANYNGMAAYDLSPKGGYGHE